MPVTVTDELYWKERLFAETHTPTFSLRTNKNLFDIYLNSNFTHGKLLMKSVV